MVDFEHLGYFIEYYVNKKLIGTERVKKKDRPVIGYAGRRDDVLKTNKTFGKKTIKAGTNVLTIIYPLNGKYIK